MVRELTHEDYRQYEREAPVKGQRAGEIDVTATTASGNRVCFEVYFRMPDVSNVLQKIKARRRRMPNCVWVALIPQHELVRYGAQLAHEGIHVAAWHASKDLVSFFIAHAYSPKQD